jgi:tetratricopeptide (TPR) repeat protein
MWRAGLLIWAAALGACLGQEPAPTYAGSATCARCHPGEHRAWTGSHHDLAMQEATPQTVLGATSAEFTRDGDRFTAAGLPVRYTFGVAPLQQYLLQGERGRLHAWTTAWDARPREQGGQRWYSLHGDERVAPGDVLHWQGPGWLWNAQCAECHSTGLRKRYEPERDEYRTTYAELDVACEACHGPGSAHVEDPKRPPPVRLRERGQWVMDPATGIARRSEPRRTSHELDLCSRCHSRRTPIHDSEPGTSFLDAYRPALLDEGLYFADGQIQDEVYEYGSFLQSRMHAAGVTCSDCHDPHQPTIAGDPDVVCAKCHAPQKFAVFTHHRHRPGSKGASCVACHMPARTYMGVDRRRDHGFRVPRPDHTLRHGVPNTCVGCHPVEEPGWGPAALERWFPDSKVRARPHWAPALHAARTWQPQAPELLRGLVGDAAQPAIARATAASLLERFPGPRTAAVLAAALQDNEPLVRYGALLGGAPPEAVLSDPCRLVRVEATRRRATAQLDLRELEAAAELHVDRAAGHVGLAALRQSQDDAGGARRHLQRAIALEPHFMPGYVNLADLERSSGDEPAAERALRAALRAEPSNPQALHALGLCLVRQQRRDEGLEALRRAAELAPQEPRFAYVHAVGLHDSGKSSQALALLRAAQRRFPAEPSILEALAAYCAAAGLADEARDWARRLEAVR